MIYDITPVPKPRMTRRDKFKPSESAKRYFIFANECKLKKVKLPQENAGVYFYIPMPNSWSDKKKDEMVGNPHKQRPDLSNLLKALEDAVYGDDSVIWSYSTVEKRWAHVGSIEIR